MPEIAKAPFKRMVRKIQPEMKISEPAKREIRRITEKFAMEVLRGAVQIAKVSKRKTVMREDIIVSKRQLIKTV
jgi:histone H3/H4